MNNIKEKISEITSVLSFIIGFGLVIAGFCVPPLGEVSNSVLAILGQCLLYTGTILGISSHYQNKLEIFENEVRNKLK